MFDLPLIPPGRREVRERWSASGVEMQIAGRSALPDGAWRALCRTTGALALGALISVGVAHLPLPASPRALACVGELRWTDACKSVGPKTLEHGMAPDELARRIAANWDFERTDGPWRAGSISYHLLQRVKAARSATDPVVRARAAASLANVIEAPTPYGGWVPDDQALAAEADAIAALYAEQADAAWKSHQSMVRASYEGAIARRATVAAWGDGAAPWLGALWLVLTALTALAWLTRRRAQRPFDLHLDPHQLRLDQTQIPMSHLDRIEVRWGQLDLTLRDGSRWVSRPLSPRNPARLELLVMAQVASSQDAIDEERARDQVHRALSAVLTRASA